jgi:hypothetical protein
MTYHQFPLIPGSYFFNLLAMKIRMEVTLIELGADLNESVLKPKKGKRHLHRPPWDRF